MGRPLPRKFFEQENLRIPVLADLGNGNVEAWLVGQERTGAYWATDGVDRLLVVLINEEPTVAGQALCIVETPDGDKNVRQINMNDVKTFDGFTLKWVYADPVTGQGAFKAGAGDKDQGADPFTIGVNSVFDIDDPGILVADNEVQFSVILPAGSYDGLHLIFFFNDFADIPFILDSSYDSGGTFYFSCTGFGDVPTVDVYAKLREDDGYETPTLLLSNTVTVNSKTNTLTEHSVIIDEGSQYNDNAYQTTSTTPTFFVEFAQNDGLVDNSVFYVIYQVSISPETQATLRYNRTLSANDITNGFTFQLTGAPLSIGEHEIKSYYVNPDGDISFFNRITMEVVSP